MTGVEGVIDNHLKIAESFEKTLKRITSAVSNVNTLHADAVKQFGAKSAVNDKLGEISKIQQTAVDSNKILGSLLDEKKASGVDTLVARLHNTASLAYKATAEIERLTAAVSNYNAVVKSSGSVKFNFLRDKTPGSVSPGGKDTTSIIPFADVPGKDKKGSIADEFMDKSAFFMLRYRLYSSVFEGIMFSLNDILLGRARQDLAKQLGELTAVAFNSSQRKETEVAAQIYSNKFWNTTTEEYVKAMAMTATAFDVNRVGFTNLERMNEAAIGMSKISQMTADKSAELMTGMIMQILSRLPEEARKKIQSGESALVKGYGETTLGGLAETIAAQSAKAIQVATIKGSGIASAFKHALPVMLEQGWDVAAGLSFVSMMKNMGFHEGQIGRATKDMMITAPTAFAKAVLYGSTDKYGQTYYKQEGYLDGQGQILDKKGAQEWNDRAVNILSGKIRQSFSDPDEYSKMMVVIGQKIRIAQSKNIDLVKELGLSKDFLSQILAYTQPGAQADFQAIRQEIAKADISEMTQMVVDQLLDAGTAWVRISNSFNNLFQTMADSEIAHGIAAPVTDAVNYMNFYQKFAGYYKGWSAAWAKEDFEAKYEKDMLQFFGPERTEMMKARLTQNTEEHWRRKWIPLETAIVGAIAGTFAGGPILGTLIGAGAGLLLGDQSYTMDRMFYDNWEKQRKNEENYMWNAESELGSFFPTDYNGGLVKQAIDLFASETQSFSESLFSAAVSINKAPQAIYDFVESVVQFFRELSWEKIGNWINGRGLVDSAGSGAEKEGLTDSWFSQKYSAFKDYLSSFGWVGSPDWELPTPGGVRWGHRIVNFNTDTTLGAEMLKEPEQLPQLLPSPGFPYMPFAGQPIQVSEATETPIQIENRLILDGRELAYAVAEIIQRNRASNYMGFGADPFGYNVG